MHRIEGIFRHGGCSGGAHAAEAMILEREIGFAPAAKAGVEAPDKGIVRTTLANLEFFCRVEPICAPLPDIPAHIPGAVRADPARIFVHRRGGTVTGFFSLDTAILCAAKVAYLTALIMSRKNTIDRFQGQDIASWMVTNPTYNKLNKVKKTSPEAFYYFYRSLELMKLLGE